MGSRRFYRWPSWVLRAILGLHPVAPGASFGAWTELAIREAEKVAGVA